MARAKIYSEFQLRNKEGRITLYGDEETVDIRLKVPIRFKNKMAEEMADIQRKYSIILYKELKNGKKD